MVPRGGEEDGRKSSLLRWLWVRLVSYLLVEEPYSFALVAMLAYPKPWPSRKVRHYTRADLWVYLILRIMRHGPTERGWHLSTSRELRRPQINPL